MTQKARIAHLAGPNATIQNTPPLVTSTCMGLMLFGEIPPTAIDGTRPRKSGSHRTPRWREPDSNPRSPSPRSDELSCRLHAGDARTSCVQISGAAQLDLFFAASHSMEPGANAVRAACGVTSPRSDAGRFLSFANATCALALGEQPLRLPAIEFMGA